MSLRAIAQAILLVAAFVLLAPASGQASCTDKPEPGVDWSKCGKTKVIMRGQDLSGAKFENADLSASTLSEATLKGANLVRANLTRTSFREANLEGADLTKAFGQRTSFKGARLVGAVLSKAEILRADFAGADLTNADLSKAELSRATMAGATLDGVNLQHSNLSRADFAGASLAGTDFLGAYMYLTKLQGVDLSQAKNLEDRQLEVSCGDEATRLPEGIAAPAGWPCGEE